MSNVMTIDEWRKHNVKKHAKKSSGGANALTKRIIIELNSRGYEAWRNNTMGVFDGKKAAGLIFKNKHQIRKIGDVFEYLKRCYRKSHEKKGVSDVIGYHKKTGRFIAVEVKYGKDTLKPHQQYFIQQVSKAGGTGIVAKTFEQFLNDLEKLDQ